MLPELKDAGLDHPDYRGAGGLAVSTRQDTPYCHVEIFRAVRPNSSEYRGMTRLRAARSRLRVHHVNPPARALGASRFIDEVGDLARVLDPIHCHDAFAQCVSVR